MKLINFFDSICKQVIPEVILGKEALWEIEVILGKEVLWEMWKGGGGSQITQIPEVHELFWCCISMWEYS